VASVDNYIEIFSENEGGITKNLLRNTLRKAEESLLNYPYLFKCHRAYIVNLQKIQSVIGNSQGYKLVFDKIEQPIPVARSQSKQLKELLFR
ncbi:LytTR family transcriptional regulator, partial [Candidatus Amoebophilus asiaticus]|nr:LytTR family transcriptional regulator [Candidatus Amoebophilus asiaticus]